MLSRFAELSTQSLELITDSAVLIRDSEALREKCKFLRAASAALRIQKERVVKTAKIVTPKTLNRFA